MFLQETEYSFDIDKITEAYNSIFPSKFNLWETPQVCLNSRLNSPDPYFEAIGPDRGSTIGIEHPILNEVFKGTYFEEIVNTIGEIGRIRIMHCLPRSCLSLHYDIDMRYQLAIIPSEHAYLVHQINETDLKMYNIPGDGIVRLLNSRDMRHSAINFGMQMRIHLVFSINKTRMSVEEAIQRQPKTE